MSHFRRTILLVATGLALGAGGPRSAFGDPAQSQTFVWPGQFSGGKSIYSSSGYGYLIVQFGRTLPLVSLADEERAPTTETDPPFNDNKVGGSTPRTGEITLTLTTSIHAGHVSADMVVVSNEAYNSAADGKALGSQQSTGTAHFDVSPCPEVDGVAGGHISFQLRQETIFPDGSRSSSTSRAEGPFRIINGADAHRVRTEVSLQLSASSLHTGPPASGTDPVAWELTGPFNYSWGANGSLDIGAVDKSQWKGSGEFPNDALAPSPAGDGVMGFLLQLDPEVEKFWRSGKCIKLKPSEKDRKVNPHEKIELTVESEQRFDQQEVKAPIKADLTGVKSVDPSDKPVDEPATFNFVAGEKRDDWGKIELTQTGKRGIGRESVTFTVKPPALALSCDASFSLRGLGNRFDGHLHISEAPLTLQDDGTYRGTGNMRVTGPFTSGDDECHADINYMNPVELLAIVDPKDASSVRVQITPTYVNYTTMCNPVPKQNLAGRRRSRNLLNPYLALDFWGRMMANRKLTLSNPTTFNDSLAQGAQTKTSTTLTMTYSDDLKP